jgi:hypothetical protein
MMRIISFNESFAEASDRVATLVITRGSPRPAESAGREQAAARGLIVSHTRKPIVPSRSIIAEKSVLCCSSCCAVRGSEPVSLRATITVAIDQAS